MTKLAKIVADFQTSLATKISVGGTNFTLQSKVDNDDVAIIDGQYYFTIDGDNSQKEYVVGIYDSATGVVSSLINVSRQGAETAGVVREHRVGAVVTITDFGHIKVISELLDGTTDWDGTVPIKYDSNPVIIDDKHLATKKYADDSFVAINGDQSVQNIKDFYTDFPTGPEAAPTLDIQLCNKKYADDLAIAGSPDADLVTKGIAEEATAAEIAAGTQVGGTGAELFVNPKYLSDAGIKLPSSCLTLIPRSPNLPDVNHTEPYVSTAMAVNTTGWVGQIIIPYQITINSISFSVAVTGAGTYKIGLYSEDGNTLLIDHTTANLAVTGFKTEALTGAPVTLPSGIYYLMIVPQGAANVAWHCWYTFDNSFYKSVAGKPIIEGKITGLVAGTLPATINPSTITSQVSSTAVIRLDN